MGDTNIRRSAAEPSARKGSSSSFENRLRSIPLAQRLGLVAAVTVVVLTLFEVTKAHAVDVAINLVIDESRYRLACTRLLLLIEGPFGALVTTAAGIGAVISSALGGFKIAWVLIVTAVGAFILRSYTTLFFGGSCFDLIRP